MTRENITNGLRGKVVQFHNARPFAAEKVTFYNEFIIVSGGGSAIALDNKYIRPLLCNGEVEVTITRQTGKPQHFNVTLQ